MAQVAQRDCGVSVLEDIQNPTSRGPEQPPSAYPALSKGLG